MAGRCQTTRWGQKTSQRPRQGWGGAVYAPSSFRRNNSGSFAMLAAMRRALILREAPHIGPSEVGHRGASREMPRRGTRREVSRTAARGEVARMAGYLDLIRSLGQGAARRRPREPHNLAHKMKRESQLFRQIRK